MHGAKRVLATLSGTALLLGAGAAAAADWRLVEVTGRVRVAAPGKDPTVGAANLAVPPGADITTAGGARAVLSDGERRIVIGPNSRMTVSAGQPAGMTRIMQDLGSIVFQVNKQAQPHFRVDTPLLAAVVKGTTFTVSVGAVSDTVHVAEGLVEVRANGGGVPNDIPSGVTGRVTRDAPDQVGVIAPVAVATPEPAAQSLPALDYSQVSEGVVAGPGAPQGRDLAAASPRATPGPDGSAGDASGGGEPGMTLASAAVAAMAQTAAQSANTNISAAAPANPSGDNGNGNGDGPPASVPAGPGANSGGGNGGGDGPPASVPAGPGANNGAGNGPPAGVPTGPGANNGNGNGPPAGVPAGPGANNGNGNGPPAGVPAGPGANNGNGNGPPADAPAGPAANNGNGNGPPAGVPAGPGANDGNGNGPPAGVPAGPGANNGNGNGPPADAPTGPAANNGNGNGPPASPPAGVPAGPGANNGNGNGPPADVPAGPAANNGNSGGPPANGPGTNNGNGNGPPTDVPNGAGDNNGKGNGGGQGRQA